MIFFKCAIFALCVIFAENKNIVNNPYEPISAQSEICENIAIAVHSLESLNEADFWNFYDCAADNNDICVACEDMVFNLRNTFGNSIKEDEFLSICKAYNIETLSSQCDLIKEQCMAEFILLLNSKITSSSICTSVQSSNATINALLNSNSENIKCEICEKFLQDVKNFLNSESIKLGIQNVLKTICDLTPDKVKKECIYYTHKYYEYFYKLVEKLDPKRICSGFSVYTSLIKETVYANNFENWAVSPFNTELCSTCKQLVKFIQKLLNDQQTDEEVKSVVKKICKLIPSKTKVEKCEQYVIKYTDLIIGVLAVEADPSLVCPMIKLCNAETGAENISTINYADIDTNEITFDNNNRIDIKSISDWDTAYRKKNNDDNEIADVILKQIEAICLQFHANEDEQLECYDTFLTQLLNTE